MKMAIIGNRVRAGVLFTLPMAVLLVLVMTHAAPAPAQATATVLVSNLDQPSSARYTVISPNHHYAQSFCTGSVATTLDKVRLYTISKEADRNTMFYEHDPAPVVTIRSTDAWGKPGAVLHTLTNPVIDGSKDTAEDFTSSGYELAANTTYSVAIYQPSDSGHFAFVDTESTLEETEPQLGWTIGDQYMYLWDAGEGWTDTDRQGFIMKMAVYASGALPSVSTPAFTDCGDTRSSYQFSVDENAPEDTFVGVAAAGDADGDSMTYSVSGTDAAKFNNVFNLNASTGEITVKSGANIDYESSDKSYSVTVSVTDGEDASGAAETEPTLDATVSVRIDVIDVDEPGIVTLSTTAPRVGSALTATVSDPDSSVLVYTVQWARAANADAPFIDIPIDPGYMANPTYTPTAADQGTYLKVTMFYAERDCGEVSSFDDRCRREATKTLTTLVANAEGLIVQSQRVNRPATGEPRIIGAPPPGYQWVGWLGIWVSRNTVRDPDGMNSGVSFQWLRVDPDTLAEENIQNATGWTYVPTRADLGRGIKVRASFVDNLGSRESRTSQPIWAPRPPNNPATGSPGIAGAVQVGQTLSADTSGISDADVIVDSTFAYQWIVNDGTDDTDIQDATGATYTLGADDEGKTIKVKVSFTDEVRYEESLTSAPTATVASQESSFTATTHDVPESHDGATEFAFELRFNEEPGSGFSYAKLRNDNAFMVTGGSVSNVGRLEPGKNVRWKITVTPSGDAAVSVSLPATTDCAAEGAICNMRNMKLSSALEFTVSGPGTSNQQTPPENSAATGAPTINGTAQVGETLTASTSAIADTDGLASATFAYQWLADDSDISGATGSSYSVAAADEGKVIKVTVSFTDDAGNAETLTSAATAAVAPIGGTTNSLERSNQEDVQENSAAAGAPTIGGTAQVGESLTASTSDISDADGLANASFTYQWLADDADIDDATTSSYTLVAGDVGKAIKVTVSFTDDEGNEESVTSAATAVVTQPPLTATFHEEPSSHDGEAAFTLELRFSEEPASGFSYTTVRDHAFTVTDGSVSNVERLEAGKNVRWEITVTPDADADVTIALNATTDCSAEGAICNADGGMLGGDLELVVPGPQENSAATGAPTINGTAQVGETLTASTSAIADSDGLASATFTYQWLADDTDISGATGSSYTVAAADEGKVIKVTVSFTDDAGNAETLTSAATAAVALPALRLQTAAVDGATLTLTYNNDLDEGVTLPTSAFTVSVAGNTRSVSSLSVSGRAVTLTLAPAVAAGEAVTVSYARPDGSSFIRDTQGNRAGSFSGETVTNNTVEQAANNPATGAPGINGTAQTGQTLTATTSDVADEDGLTGAAFTHQWVRSDSGTDTDIDAATGSTYVVATADEGKVIRVRVSFTDDLGNSESLTSNGVTAAAVPDDPEDPIERRTDPDGPGPGVGAAHINLEPGA